MKWFTSKVVLVVLLIVILETIFVGRSFTALGIGMLDAKLFAYMGSMVNEGMHLYVDIWDNKPPGIFWVSALAASLPLDQFHVLALFESTIVFATIYSLFLILKTLHIERLVILFTIITSAILLNIRFYNEGGNFTETYLLLPMVISVLLFIIARQKNNNGLYLLAGLMSGIATLFKLPGLSPFLAETAFLVLMMWKRQLTIGKLLGIFSLLTLGLSIPWVLVVAYFGTVGGLQELLNISFIYPFAYGVESQKGVFAIIASLIEVLQPVYPLIPLVLITVFQAMKGIVIRESINKPQDEGCFSSNFHVLICLWLAADLSGALAGGRFYPHYFLAMMPSLVVAAGIGLDFLFSQPMLFKSVKRQGKIMVVILILFPLVYHHLMDVIYMARKFRSHDSQSTSQLMTERINKIKNADDLLFVWDYQPDIYYNTHLKPASRYLTSVNLWDSKQSLNLIGGQLMRDLKVYQPRFVVTRKSIFGGGAALEPVSQLFAEWLLLNYELDFEVNEVQLYHHK